ncbi:MAG TPA: O-antigen ligase family protein, partial [Nitriliruptorales bacterium]
EPSGSTGRSTIWRIGMTACEEHCLAGAGWGTFGLLHEQVLLREPFATGRQFQFEPHNAWLGTAVEAGLPGIALLLGGIVALGVALGRLPREPRGPPLAGLVALVLTNTFLSNQDFKYFWLALTYAAVVAASSRAALPGPPPVVVPEPSVREDVRAQTLERI